MVKILHRILYSSKFCNFKYWLRDIFVNTIIASYLMPMFLRVLVLNIWGCRLKGVIHGHCTLLGNNLVLGKGSFINKNCLFDNAYAKVVIGDNVAVSHSCLFLTTNHVFSNENQRGGAISANDITIEDGVWIGAGVTLLPGTFVGKGCVIAAGSVVRGNLLSNKLYAGNPARIIKDI